MLAWHFDKHGTFSVKSAYKVGRDDAIKARCAGSHQGGSANSRSGVWTAIWKLKCLNKVKHFLWRLSHNSHPRRGMNVDIRCPVCGEVGEDGGHLFFKCRLAKHIWRLLNLETEREALAETRCIQCGRMDSEAE